MQAAVSVIRNSEVVRYSGASTVTVLNIWRYCSSVRYLVEVRYWECPLIESPLYTRYGWEGLGVWGWVANG